MTTPDKLTLLVGLLDVTGTLCVLAGIVVLLRLWRRQTPSDSKMAWLHADLSQPHFIERLIYRHHRGVGALLITASVLWLWLLSTLDPWRIWLRLTWHYLRELFSSGVVIWLGLNAIAVSTLVFGMILALRPSRLKRLEAAANRWVNLVDSKRPPTTRPQTEHQRRWRLAASVLLLLGCLFLVLASLLHASVF